MSSITKSTLNIITVIFFAWFSFNVTILLHEWTHGLFAWIFGYKTSPFNIYYGHFGWSNIFWQQIDQFVNNPAIAFIGHPYQAGITPIVPPIVINGGLGFISLFWLQKKLEQGPINKFVAMFMFSFILWNIGEFFNYTCLRSFSTHADIGLFLHYFNLSPWLIFIPGLYLSIWAYYRILGPLSNMLYLEMKITSKMQIIIFLASCFILFVFQPLFGFRFAFDRFGPVVIFVNILCLLILPIYFYIFWPKGKVVN